MTKKGDQIRAVLARAKDAAVEYYELTGKPLGITGEIGEFYAAEYLHYDLAGARTTGYDALDKAKRKIQIKSRAFEEGKSLGGVSLGEINLKKEFDIVLMVLMNQRFEVLWMYEADRAAVKKALSKPGSKARDRGQLAASQFIRIGKQVWPRPGLNKAELAAGVPAAP